MLHLSTTTMWCKHILLGVVPVIADTIIADIADKMTMSAIISSKNSYL